MSTLVIVVFNFSAAASLIAPASPILAPRRFMSWSPLAMAAIASSKLEQLIPARSRERVHHVTSALLTRGVEEMGPESRLGVGGALAMAANMRR